MIAFRRRLTLPLALAAGLALPTSVGAADPPPPTYAVSVLPVAFASSSDMSGAGHVAGVAYPSGLPFVWSATGGLVSLPMPAGSQSPQVLGVSASGWVLGTVSTATGTQGLVWKPSGGAYTTVTIPPPSGKSNAIPVAIDETNRVVGSAGTTGSIFRSPFLWTDAGGSRDLVALGYPNELPTSISPTAGWVAGATVAYRLGDPTSVTPLPALPSPFVYPYTHGIADDGDRFVVGLYPSSMYGARLFRLDAATGAWRALWSSDMFSAFHGVSDVNALGDMVGFRRYLGEVSWAPGDPMVSLQSQLVGGYAGVPTDLWPGMPVSGVTGISDGRHVLASATMGNNSGRLVRLTPAVPCTSATCLRVATLTVGATNPTTCTPGATLTASGTLAVRDQNGRAASGASVRVVLMSQYSTATASVTTDRRGNARFSGRLGVCEGTVTALVESVSKAGTGFDRSAGVLIRSALPTVR